MQQSKSLFYIYPILRSYIQGNFLEKIDQKYRAVEEKKDNGQAEIYSQRVRAGKRTYFFDVKATRSNDYYLTITESKRRYKDDGYYYEKHKIFLYKEDFNKFITALNGTVDHVKTELLPEVDFDQFDNDEDSHNYKSKDTETENSELGSDLKWD